MHGYASTVPQISMPMEEAHRILHRYSQTRLMQVLPGHALTDPGEHTKQKAYQKKAAARIYGSNTRTAQHCRC